MTAPHDDAVHVSAPDSFQAWAEAADRIRATTKRLAKGAVLEAYLPTLSDEALPIAAHFFSGIVFPRHDARTTQVGGSIVFGAFREITGLGDDELHERYVALGDSGDLARELFADRPPSGITLAGLAGEFAALSAAAGTNARREMVRALLAPLGALEAAYAVKLLGGGELRIGLKEAQVEEAVAKAFGAPLTEVRRANLLRGDVGEVALYARRGTLAEARLALFHPIGFMLAQPLPTAGEIVAAMPSPFIVEDKYDGIRAQAHVSEGRVALFSRTLDDITRGYPEVVAALGALFSAGGSSGTGAAVPAGASDTVAALPAGASGAAGVCATGAAVPAGASGAAGVCATGAAVPAGASGAAGAVIDGELIAFDPADPARALPFKAFQQRLGRKAPSAALQAAVPVAFVAYDAIAWDGALIVDEPWHARRARLASLGWPAAPDATARLAPARRIVTAEELEDAFSAARDGGNEGIIAKDPASPYTPGRRGKTWIKLKKALATLDVVVTGAERGHGRRRGVLSDYTFAVRASETDPTLLNVGKAYNGLTDAEIVELTQRFDALTIQRFGRFHQVKPEVVLEVTFDIVQASKRHKAGYALRFPRIVRVRDDKPASEIDTLARVQALAGDAPPDESDDGDGEA